MAVPTSIYPFEGRYVERRGFAQHYLDEGAGEPIVMVHGNPTWSIYYRSLVLALRDDYRCIVPDHLGCGRSDKPPLGEYDYQLASRIDDLEALIDGLELSEPLTLVVHDWGGMIGMGYAVRHPERIRRLVVHNTAAFHLPPSMRVPTTIGLVRDSALASVFVQGLNGFARTASHWCTTRAPLPAAIRDAYCAPYDSWDHRLATLRFVQDIPLVPSDPSYQAVSDVEAGLAKLADKPTLLCWGAKDFVFDLRVLTEWRRRFPTARVREFADCGHYLLEDAPQEIAEEVRQFLRDTAALPNARDEHFAGGKLSNMARCLTEMAEAHPDRIAIQVPAGREGGDTRYEAIDYRTLDRESDILGAGLEAIGIGRGVRVALMVKPSPDFFRLSFAIAKVGAVPVLVDPGIGLEHLATCLAEAEPQAFIGIPSAHAARVALGWARKTIKTNVCVGNPRFLGTIGLDDVHARGLERIPTFSAAPTRERDHAAILFTSGSTGVPKGAVYTQQNFEAQIAMLRRIANIGEDEIDLPTFPVFALFDPALGMTTVIPEMDPTRPADVDPEAILTPIARFGATNMFASPALLDRVGRFGARHGRRLPTLKRVVSAGAPVSPAAIERFLRMLPEGARVITPYGATEALPVALVDSDTLLSPAIRAATESGRGVCVGHPVAPTDVRIIAIDDAPILDLRDAIELPPGETGEIIVSGPQVTAAYFNRPHQTALSKIREGERFFHRMGDLGHFDQHGRLWFCGRKSQRVITPEETLFTVPCELVFNTHPAVRRTALVGPKKNGRITPTLCVELEAKAGLFARRRLHKELLAIAQSHAHTRSIHRVLFHPKFPVDIRHNAKINRPVLTRWAERRR